MVLALDEFPYLCDDNAALPSIIQLWWDQTGRHLPIVLVLCGSFVSFMESLALESGELYGRRTRQLILQPFDHYDASLFFPSYSPEDRLRAYAVLGGMPAYLAVFSEEATLSENIYRHILYPETFLGQEARWILLEELRAERVYHSILRAIARGKTRPSEIASAVGMKSANRVSPYLERLRDLRLIERRIPVADDPERPSRRSLYVLADHYLRFWYRFVEDNLSYIELGMQDLVLREKVLPHLDHYVSKPGFESACAQFLWRQLALGRLPMQFNRLGAWWNDREEIDLVALDGTRIVLVGECKWTETWVKLGDLGDLKRKASVLGVGPDVGYVLFSRSGFDPNLVATARAERVLLYSVSD
ncbi:MAG: ATP-binding protein, partial [Chloroflexi bacterium]|nr:ATP-binding protein [Chloroflexota bacterium]